MEYTFLNKPKVLPHSVNVYIILTAKGPTSVRNTKNVLPELWHRSSLPKHWQYYQTHEILKHHIQQRIRYGPNFNQKANCLFAAS